MLIRSMQPTKYFCLCLHKITSENIFGAYPKIKKIENARVYRKKKTTSFFQILNKIFLGIPNINKLIYPKKHIKKLW